MERAVANIASAITIIGFLMAISQVSELGALDFEIASDVKPLVGSLLFAFITVLLMAVCFGYAFGYLVVTIEKHFGRLALVFSTPILGMLSAFQTGVVTLAISRIFDISSMLTLVFFVSFFVSAAIETMFVFRHFDRIFQGDTPIVFEANKYPKFSISSSLVNHIFFCVGTLVFLADSKLPQNEGAWIGAFFAVPIFGFATYSIGMALYRIMDDGEVENLIDPENDSQVTEASDSRKENP